MKAVMRLAQQNFFSFIPNKELKLQEAYLRECSKYMRIKILTALTKQKTEVCIGRTELPL
jgi:hypothetical protein